MGKDNKNSRTPQEQEAFDKRVEALSPQGKALVAGFAQGVKLEPIVPEEEYDPGKVMPGDELSPLGLEGYKKTHVCKPKYPDREDLPILSLGKTPVLRRGHLSLLSSKAGFGKSNVVESVAAAYVKAYMHLEDPAIDTLNYSCNVPVGSDGQGLKLLLIDSERDPKDTELGMVRMLKRLYPHYRDPLVQDIRNHELYNASVPGIKVMNMLQVDKLAERIALLLDMIEHANYAFVIVDGIGDFVNDTNNLTECNDFIGMLVANCSQFEVGLLMTLHQNPRDDKARGHLGTTCWQKCESCFAIVRDAHDPQIRAITSDLTKFEYGKVRSYADNHETMFSWNDEAGFFTVTDVESFEAENPMTPEQIVDLILELISIQKEQFITRVKLMGILQGKYGLQEQKIKRAIKGALDQEKFIQSKGGIGGNKIVYKEGSINADNVVIIGGDLSLTTNQSADNEDVKSQGHKTQGHDNNESDQ